MAFFRELADFFVVVLHGAHCEVTYAEVLDEGLDDGANCR